MTLVSPQTCAPKTKFNNKKPEIVLNINYCPHSLAFMSCNSVNYSGSKCLFSVVENMRNPDNCIN